MNVVAAYYRISTTDQRVDLQRDAILSLCERHKDWHIIEYLTVAYRAPRISGQP